MSPTPGAFVVRPGGFSVLPGGGFAVFNASGECPECCDQYEIDLGSLSNSLIMGGGTGDYGYPGGDPDQDAYDLAFAAIPDLDGAQPTEITPAGLGWTWVNLAFPVANISVYGGHSGEAVDTSMIPPGATVTLELSVANHGGNNWAGSMDFQVRYRTNGDPFSGGVDVYNSLAGASAEGTQAGTISMGSGDAAKVVNYDLSAAYGDWLSVAVIPVYTVDPGYPGVDQGYIRAVSVTARLYWTV